MSNFESFALVTEGLPGTAPQKFVASTVDAFATIVAAGYMNDQAKRIKANDVVDINYLDASVFPLNTGEAALFASFLVQYDPTLNNWNLIPNSQPVSVIAAMGVHSATYSNAGGSATTVVNDPAISPNSVVLARWKSQANASIIKTVAPANGQFTVVSSADPGASVLEYMAFLPSVLLQNNGVYAAKYSNAGGSATIVIPNANVVAGMVVNANFVSQANAAEIKTVIAGAGSITIVATADPGVSVISYSAVAPSSALTGFGLYGAQYTNAGGSATTSITDANIKANSIVIADWASQANAAEIYTVLPGAGTLTIVSSADPGASVLNYIANPAPESAGQGTYLLSSNNLSDVQNAATSLANLGGAPLAGGQLTGSLYAAKGTGTVSGGAVTINKQAGVITTTSLTTAAGSSATVTLTNSQISSSSVVLVSLMGGTNTTIGIQLSATAGSGSSTITIANNNAASALNGTLLIGFAVL